MFWTKERRYLFIVLVALRRWFMVAYSNYSHILNWVLWVSKKDLSVFKFIITVSIIFFLSSLSYKSKQTIFPFPPSFFGFFFTGELLSPLPSFTPLDSLSSHVLLPIFKSLDFFTMSWLLDFERDFDLLLLELIKKECTPWLTFNWVVPNWEIERNPFPPLFLHYLFLITFCFFYLFDDFYAVVCVCVDCSNPFNFSIVLLKVLMGVAAELKIFVLDFFFYGVFFEMAGFCSVFLFFFKWYCQYLILSFN